MVWDSISLNEIFQNEKNRIVYCSVNKNGLLEGPGLIEVKQVDPPFYFIIYYESGRIHEDGYVFSIEDDSFYQMIHFQDNMIDHIYNCTIKENGIVDTEGGSRWEGTICIGMDDHTVRFPFGKGIHYNEEGLKDFQGIWLRNEWCGYGIAYWNGVIKSKGFVIQGKEFGSCIHYDRTGSFVDNAMWINGTRQDDSSRTTLSRECISKLETLPKTVRFSVFSFLEEVHIPSSFKSDCSFVSFQYLPFLKSIRLGKASFSEETLFVPPYTPGIHQVFQQQQKHLVITDCPCLSTVWMDSLACSDFCILTIRGIHLDSLMN